MPEPLSKPQPQPVPLCASDALVERGRAVCWSLWQYGRPTRAFALRFDGRVVAYLNRCAHVPVEMDWQEGEFLDLDKRWIVCSIHGATYEPRDGRCIAGPCTGARLTPVTVREADGQVLWWPDRDLDPAPAPTAPATVAVASSGPTPEPAA